MMSSKMLGAVLGVAILVVACGSSSTTKDGSSSGTEPSSDSRGTGSSSPTKAQATSTTLQLVDTPLGKVVADSDGMVLYLFVPDADSPTSKVPEAVLASWPPVQASETVTLGPGLTKAAATPTQPNGEKWVSYNNHLLYGFTGDTAPGDVNGNGLGEVWYVVDAAGEPVKA